jgi:formamidopyrimidine-DNA glycosylase
MPELPDLQVFSKNLTKLLKNKKVKEVRVPKAKKLNVPVKKLKEVLEGKKLQKVEREGKELHFIFAKDVVLALHLMLRGKLHFFEGDHSERFPVIELRFSDKSGLVMTDFQGQATPTLNPPEHDGVDALSTAMNLTFFKSVLEKSKASVKNLLLDQHVIRGIGNAYADEIFWEARISPLSIASKIPAPKVKALYNAIGKVLKAAEKSIIKKDPDIISGEIRDFMKIHNSRKTHSPTGAAIKIHAGSGRKTYYTDEQVLFK